MHIEYGYLRTVRGEVLFGLLRPSYRGDARHGFFRTDGPRRQGVDLSKDHQVIFISEEALGLHRYL